MDFEGISPIQSSERTPRSSPRPRSGARRPPTFPSLPKQEPHPESETREDVEVEFSSVDPEIGAILTQVSSAGCDAVTEKIKRLLSE